ncbi:nonstructural protein [Salmonella enterica subsp. enterica]|uniref:Nonstructural protein n=1 Tax=Salmonella enterica subsp. enterica serovar Durham TaxID=1954178 RepID=A0A5H8RSF0_SALET|nr:nonstructural protein [Salmonella enterica subsp. enterica serovar Telelkebir]EBB7905693.1 nonstructural protein [Salmonella enterica]EBX1543583.1 nonstructural protein [Salmonella enterica subsp. enterica serovar Wa]ECD6441003.1 nonstructural protein [Salmonella enterica subsp. enterica serovar Durham]ECQ1750793.1 nonstructural protein [Salmonella enterica subsp. enterica serovar Malstatt]EDT2050454.1 nonstructural protein [Salmonella enterica subsp. enterica serovar Agbeni]EDV3145396.1 n
MRRRKMTRRGSRKNFRRHAGTHKKNRPRRLTRGGFRI